jgi:DNA-binding MarR family transcriptional regulator
MNAVFFGLKRAHHSVLGLGRGTLKKVGLTAARFDLLFALTENGRRRLGWKRQSAVRRILGVTRPTVSRMVRSLELLGIVKRRRCRYDRRQLQIAFTPRGWFRFRFTYRHLTRSGWAQLAVDSALGASSSGGENLWYDMDHCLSEMATFEEYLGKIRYAFRDFGKLEYLWHPFDRFDDTA